MLNLLFREDEFRGTDSSIEDSNPNSLEDVIESDDGPGSKSPGGGGDSYTSKELGSSSRPEELGSQVKDTHVGQV